MDENRDYLDRLYLCMNQIDGLYYMAARKLKIKNNMLSLFYTLNDGKPHSQKEISEECLIPRTTINTIVKECVAQGYVLLESDGHKKEKQIVLTEKGRKYAERILKDVYTAEEIAMHKTMEEYSPELIKGLEIFTSHLRDAFHREILDKEEQ